MADRFQRLCRVHRLPVNQEPETARRINTIERMLCEKGHEVHEWDVVDTETNKTQFSATVHILVDAEYINEYVRKRRCKRGHVGKYRMRQVDCKWYCVACEEELRLERIEYGRRSGVTRRGKVFKSNTDISREYRRKHGLGRKGKRKGARAEAAGGASSPVGGSEGSSIGGGEGGQAPKA